MRTGGVIGWGPTGRSEFSVVCEGVRLRERELGSLKYFICGGFLLSFPSISYLFSY